MIASNTEVIFRWTSSSFSLTGWGWISLFMVTTALSVIGYRR